MDPGDMTSSGPENQIIVGVLILGLILFIWLIVQYAPPKNLVPMYYGPYDPNAAPQVSAWQQTTQGGIPNIIDGKGPNGEPLGIFDYLGYSMSGYNNVPGNLEYAGYTDCGCGCGGAKDATSAVNAAASAAVTAVPVTPASANPIQVPPATTATSVPLPAKGAPVKARGNAKKATATPVTGSSMTKVPPKSASTGTKSFVKSFFNDPMDIHNQDAWCQAGSVPGGRTSCPNGVAPMGPTGNGIMAPGGRPGPSLQSFSSRFFGRAPQDALAETSYVQNSARALNSVYWPIDHAREAAAQGQSMELQLALDQLPSAASQTDAAFTAVASAAANTSATDNNRINASQDSPVNQPRTFLKGGILGNFRGMNEVSSMDHRRRGHGPE